MTVYTGKEDTGSVRIVGFGYWNKVVVAVHDGCVCKWFRQLWL